MSDNFDKNDYGGIDCDGDGKVDAAENDLDDDDIKYNQNHPFRRKKNNWKKTDEEIIAGLKSLSKSGRVQLLVYALIYCVFAVFAGVTGGYEGFIYWLILLIPYMIVCLLISVFIIEPLAARAKKKRNKTDIR